MGGQQAVHNAEPKKAERSERAVTLETRQAQGMTLPLEAQVGLLDMPGLGEAQMADVVLGLQRAYGNGYVQRLVAGTGSPGVALIQRTAPTDAEVEASWERAGVNPEFPAIWGDLMTEADHMAAILRTYQDWQEATTNQDMADRMFGTILSQVMGKVRGQFLTYLIGGLPSQIVGVVVRAINAIQETLDEREWLESGDFRRAQIYVWLLKQTALCIASDERGFEVSDWDAGVQGTYSMLVSQTVNYQSWMASDDAQELSRRAREARGGESIISSGD